MNLQTGKKEAKLMDRDDGSKYLAQKDGQKQKFVKIDKNFISKTKLKQALKDFKDVFHDDKSGQGKVPGDSTGSGWWFLVKPISSSPASTICEGEAE